MTTFHDPQPQSRRAVRQSERADVPREPQSEFAQQQPAAPRFYSEPSASGDMWDTVARRAAQLAASASRQENPAPAGRRAAPAAPAPLGEPLTYSTQSTKPPVPSYNGPSFRPRGSSTPSPDDSLPPTQALPVSDQPAFRPRDFSPEGRRASRSSESSWSLADEPGTPPTDLDYHTEVKPERLAIVTPIVPVSQVPPFAAPTAPDVTPAAPVGELPRLGHLTAVGDLPIEHTLTRRELRALQQAEEAALLGSRAPELVEPPRAPISPAPAAPASFDSILGTNTPAPAAEPQPVDAVDAVVGTRAPEARPFAITAPEPDPNTLLTNAITEFDNLTRSQQSAATPPPVVSETPFTQVLQQQAPQEPSTWTPPVGHWSTQVDDDEIEITLSRRVGSGSTATNALVLPSIPMGADIRGPLTGTGEIMLTGSIDLPRSLAATGQTDRFDNGGIDALFDVHDSEVIATDSSPVRAIRAVSTHTSGHGVTHTQKPKGTRALTALLIAASAMAVVVAGLLVAAFAFNVF